MRRRRPLGAHRSIWWPSATLIGTATWPPGTARRRSGEGKRLPAGRTTTCGYWWRRSCQRRRKNCQALRRGGGSPGILWRGCSPCMPRQEQDEKPEPPCDFSTFQTRTFPIYTPLTPKSTTRSPDKSPRSGRYCRSDLGLSLVYKIGYMHMQKIIQFNRL